MQYLALHHWSKFQKNQTAFGGVSQKTTQKQPKIQLSAATKTFENSKLGNHKSYTDETYHDYAPL